MLVTADNYLLGMDIGTTNMKANIMDEHGNIAASASAPNRLIFPGPNMAEQDPELWWNNAVSIFREVTSAAGPEIVKRIRGICISSQTVTLLPVDRNGEPLRNAMIWMDGRSRAELDQIIDTIGFDRYVSIIGAQPDAGFLASKLLWFKNNEPELFGKTEKILQTSSYINFKLTGKMTMDLDQAGRSQCLNITTMRWSDEVSQAIGADLNQLLPQPSEVTDVIGEVTAEAAAETGLAAGIPVIAGASDAMASMYATGLTRLGQAGESSGTTSLIFVGCDHATPTNLPLVTKACPIREMPYIFDAPITASGASLKWYLDQLGEPEKQYAEKNGINVFQHLNELAEKVPAGSNGVLYFPYLMGERAPLWNSYAKGMFIGISMDTTREDILRSVFEGTSYSIRHVIETIREAGGVAESLRITGGGAKSRTWSKIKASVLRMPVYILDERSGDVPFGDTLIAGYAVGVFRKLTDQINKMMRIREVIEPVEEWSQVYDERYTYFREMYRHLDRDLYKYEQTLKSREITV